MPSNTVTEERRAPGRPSRRDAAALEAHLLDAALQEFLAHGYGAASLNRIIASAGVSKTTLYSRFPSKEALFRAIIYQQIGRSAAAMTFDQPALDLKKGLIEYAEYALELSLKGDVLAFNRLIYSEAHRFPELGAAAAERSRLGAKQVSSFIAKCAAAKRIKCKDPDAAAEAFILMLRGWYVNMTLTNEKSTAAQRRRWIERAVQALISGWEKW